MKRIFQLIDTNVGLWNIFDLFKKERKEKIKPLITISREFGSSGSIIAQNVAKKLGRPWRLYHEQIVDQIAKETLLDKTVIKEVDESKMPFMEEMIDDFFGVQRLSLNSYWKHLSKILLSFKKRGYAIIVGRGGEFIFPDTLNIRILGDTDYRIKTIMKHKKISQEKAKEMIELADKKRVEFTRFLFKHDPRKAHHYDLTMRISDEFSPQEAVHIIVNVAKRRFKL